MVVEKLRNQVKCRIDAVSDAFLLEEIINLLDFDAEKDDLFVIPTEHLKELEISIQQMQNNQIISNDEVDAKVQKWHLR